MRSLGFGLRVLAAVAAIACPVAAKEASIFDHPPPPMMPPSGTFTAVPEGGHTFLVGQPVPLLLTVTNVTDHDLWFNRDDAERTDYTYQVQRLVKPGVLKDVPLTAFGHYLLGPIPVFGGSIRGFALPPGAWYRKRILVDRLFDMHVPGTYLIHVARKEEDIYHQTTEIPAEPITINVAPAPRGVTVPAPVSDEFDTPGVIQIEPPSVKH